MSQIFDFYNSGVIDNAEDIYILFLLDKQSQNKTLFYVNTSDFRVTFLFEQSIIQKQSDFDQFLVSIPVAHIKRIASVMNGDYSFPQKIRIIQRNIQQQPNLDDQLNENEADKIFNPANYDKIMTFHRLQYKSDQDKEIQAKMCIDVPLSNIIVNINEICEKLNLDKNQHLNMTQFKTSESSTKFKLIQAQIKGIQPESLCRKVSLYYKINKMYLFNSIQQKIGEEQFPEQFYPKYFEASVQSNDFLAWSSTDTQFQIYQGAQIGEVNYQKGYRYVGGFVDLSQRQILYKFLEMNNRTGLQQSALITFNNDLQSVLQDIVQNKNNNQMYYIQQINEAVIERKLSTNTYCMLVIKNPMSSIFIDYDQSIPYQAEQMLQNMIKKQTQAQQNVIQSNYLVNTNDQLKQSTVQQEQPKQEPKKQSIQFNQSRSNLESEIQSVAYFNQQQNYQYKNQYGYSKGFDQDSIIDDNEEVIQDQNQEKQNMTKITSDLKYSDLVYQPQQQSKDLKLSSLNTQQDKQSELKSQVVQQRQGSLIPPSSSPIENSSSILLLPIRSSNPTTQMSGNNTTISFIPQQSYTADILSILNESSDEIDFQ